MKFFLWCGEVRRKCGMTTGREKADKIIADRKAEIGRGNAVVLQVMLHKIDGPIIAERMINSIMLRQAWKEDIERREKEGLL